jgi:hypothetical protein
MREYPVVAMFAPITTEAQLEERLSRPTEVSLRGMAEMQGDLLILGAGGKMGPSLARLARRSADAAGRQELRIIAVARFSSAGLEAELQAERIDTIRCDLLDEASRPTLPQCPNVLFMMGHKFSQRDLPGTYFAMNTWLPGTLAGQFRHSRIVCFSSGNVYPFVPVDGPAPTEHAPCGPVGEYAITTWGRERMLEYASARWGTPVCLLRLNYACEARYGVLVDLAGQILAGQPIDLAASHVNVIWQGHANAVALAAFTLASSPAKVLNLTGIEKHRVRDLAIELGRRLGVEPVFIGSESTTALLSDASLCQQLFGPPELEIGDLLDLTASWLRAGGRTLGKPTRFQVRDGKF